MSTLSNLVTTIEGDAVAAEKWVINEVEALASDAVNDILLPFFRTVEPVVVTALNTILGNVAGAVGQTVVDYLTNQPMGKVFEDILNAAGAVGETALTTLAPEALTALVSLKTLALKGVSDVVTEVESVTGTAATA